MGPDYDDFKYVDVSYTLRAEVVAGGRTGFEATEPLPDVQSHSNSILKSKKTRVATRLGFKSSATWTKPLYKVFKHLSLFSSHCVPQHQWLLGKHVNHQNVRLPRAS